MGTSAGAIKAGRAYVELHAESAMRKLCASNFRLFCEEYLPAAFQSEWSSDRMRAVAAVERAVLMGGVRHEEMERGAGKSTLIIAAAVWVKAYCHHPFAILVGRTNAAAQHLLANVLGRPRLSQRLRDDFPELLSLRPETHLAAFSAKGSFRGITREKYQDGTRIRPSLVIADDVDLPSVMRASWCMGRASKDVGSILLLTSPALGETA